MTSKAEDQRLAFEAAIRANAISYSIQLFLGRGAFERAQADTLDEAIAIGAAMKAAHPSCQAQPIYYAIEPSGHSTTITPAQFLEQHAMIKTTTAKSAKTPSNTKNAERMRARRAAKASAIAPKKVLEALDREAESAKAVKSVAKAAKAVVTATAKAQKHADKIAAEMAPQKAALALLNAKPDATEAPPLVAGSLVLDDGKATKGADPLAAWAREGVCMTKVLAHAEGKRAYGDESYQVKKTARGEFHWGPVKPLSPIERAMAADKAKAAAKPVGKAAKAASKAASKAAQTLRATEAVKASVSSKAPSGKRGEALAAAQRGVIPAAPDFSAATHTRFRPKLAEVMAMVEAKNVKGLEAFVWKGFVSSSPKAILRYRDLALTALKAQS